MATTDLNPIDLLVEVIRDNTPKDIWGGSPLIAYRLLGNTNRGEIGEQFVRRYLEAAEIQVGNGDRTSKTDMSIQGYRVEVKTASLGATGTFQFNHVRYDRNYRYLICLGICPNAVVFGVWRKGNLAEGRAGNLVPMAQGQHTTYKLTKNLDDLRPIEELISWARNLPKKSP